MKKLLLHSAPAAFLVSCASQPPTVPDMGPIGDGLRCIGYALIGVAVVITLGRLL